MSRVLMLGVVGSLLLAAEAAWAQKPVNYAENTLNSIYANNSARGFSSERIRNNIYNRTVPTYNFSSANRGLFNSGGATRSKPFTGLGGGSSVSPWLALTEPFTSSANNYYTNVRPQLDQQRINQQLASRNQQMQRQLNSMAAQGPYSTTGNENMAPTGHAAAYMNYGGYYTPVQVPKTAR
ncbi:MAG TPA: hypothetical protein VEQ85_12510 [Lacipirellulaceae bacterium]|nr:hypothetical protein [Lacipirellulaceae bacterium]